MAIPALFLNLTTVTDLCSIGTLFAFVVVCAGVLVLQDKTDIPRGKFRTPYLNAKFIAPALVIIGLVLSFTVNKTATINFITNSPEINTPAGIVTSLTHDQHDTVLAFLQQNNYIETSDIEQQLSIIKNKNITTYNEVVAALPIAESQKWETGFQLFKHKIPMWIFLLSLIGLCVWAYKKNLSLIPLLGLVCCFYMMAELSVWNWIYFTIWLVIGLIIYFSFGYKNSKLNTESK